MLDRGARLDERVSGQGIGLSVVRELAQLNGGTIRIDESPLGGARIEIRFPATRCARRETALQHSPSQFTFEMLHADFSLPAPTSFNATLLALRERLAAVRYAGSAAAGARARSAVRAQDARRAGAEVGRRAGQGNRRFDCPRRTLAFVAAEDRVRHGAADRRASRGDREGAAGTSADRRLRRDRFRQDDAAAEDLPGGGPRHAWVDRSHAAATHRRARHRQSGGCGAWHDRRRRRSAFRSASPIAPDRTPAQGDDGRHPVARAGARPAAAQLRHADHRRGARAQPQHRLPARRAQARAAAAPGAARRHHLRDHRPAALRRFLRRRADHRGVRPQLSRRSALSTAGRRRRGLGAVAHRGHRRRRAGAGPPGSRRRAGLPAGREADPRSDRRRWARRDCTRPRCCRCTRACRRAIRS